MIKSEFISKKQINIVVVLKKNSNIELFKELFDYSKNYLNLNIVYLQKFDVSYINEKQLIDFYFIDMDKNFEHVFSWNFYSQMHELNKSFKLILFKDLIDKDDVRYFKNGADDIIYTNKKLYKDNDEYLRWKLFSLLRRKWDDSHISTTLIRSGVIIDLIKRKVIINNKEIKMTIKEFQVLEILITEFYKKNNFCSKNKLFKKIYGTNNSQNSRAIDQIIFRLKNKFNNDFFEINRNGIRIQ